MLPVTIPSWFDQALWGTSGFFKAHSLKFNLVITIPLGDHGRPSRIGEGRGKTGEKEKEERCLLNHWALQQRNLPLEV